MGWTAPVGVKKLRSTTTGVEVGLSSERNSGSALAVVPPAKYQLADVVLWHGASDQPDEPCTVWETATPPPATVTVSDSHVPEERAGMGGASTAEAGTATAACTVAPVSAHRRDVPGDRPGRGVGEDQEARREPRAGGRLPGAVPGGRLRVGGIDERARRHRGGGGGRRAAGAGGDTHAHHDREDHERARANGARGSHGPGSREHLHRVAGVHDGGNRAPPGSRRAACP